MAGSKRSGRRRGRRLGSVITVRQLSGTDRLNNPNSVMGSVGPVLIGGGVALLGAIGIKMWVTPTPENTAVVDNADAIGAGLGALSGLVLWNTTGKAAGAMAIGAAGLLLLASRLPGMMAGMGDAAGNGTAGMGAIVTETTMRGLQRGTRGTGAIVMSPPSGYGANAGGETVRLGRVYTHAFGTPSYQMGAR